MVTPFPLLKEGGKTSSYLFESYSYKSQQLFSGNLI